MTLEKIIEIADKAYPGGDGLVSLSAKDNTQNGDTLGLFIAQELRDVYDPGMTDAEQVWEAERAMMTAFEQIEVVLHAFEIAAAQTVKKEANG